MTFLKRYQFVKSLHHEAIHTLNYFVLGNLVCLWRFVPSPNSGSHNFKMITIFSAYWTPTMRLPEPGWHKWVTLLLVLNIFIKCDVFLENFLLLTNQPTSDVQLELTMRTIGCIGELFQDFHLVGDCKESAASEQSMNRFFECLCKFSRWLLSNNQSIAFFWSSNLWRNS